MNGTEAKNVIHAINTFWRQHPLDEPAAKLWMMELVDFDFDDVMAVIRSLARTQKWAPALAEIIGPLATDDRQTPAELFNLVKQLAGSSDETRAKCLPPEGHEAVKRMGGWSRIGMSTERDMHTLRREFERELAHVRTMPTRPALTAG